MLELVVQLTENGTWQQLLPDGGCADNGECSCCACVNLQQQQQQHSSSSGTHQQGLQPAWLSSAEVLTMVNTRYTFACC
jgi:hypothetical protein